MGSVFVWTTVLLYWTLQNIMNTDNLSKYFKHVVWVYHHRCFFLFWQDLALHSRLSPDQRQLSLRKFCESVNSVPEARGELQKWGLQLDMDVISVCYLYWFLGAKTIKFPLWKIYNKEMTDVWGVGYHCDFHWFEHCCLSLESFFSES